MATPTGFCEVWFAFTVAGDNETMYSHLGYELDGAVTQAAVNAGFTDFIDEFRASFCSDVTLQGGHLIEGAPGGGARWETSATPAVGTHAGASCPNNVATLVAKTSGFGGRRNRGRMFLPNTPEGAVGPSGIITPAYQVIVDAALPELMPGGGTHTAFGFLGDPAIFHAAGSQTPTIVTGLSCLGKAATQRRRMRR